MKKDNTTLDLKVRLRLNALQELADPIVMETHAGYGRIWWRCYRHIENGIAFEKDIKKADALARQRPTWAIYQCDCVMALKSGVGGHLPVNFLDLDPYGEPWPAIDAFFGSDRPRPDKLIICVNDGLRQKVRYASWSIHSLQAMVRKYGNASIYDRYMEICRELLEIKAAQAGYRLSRWTGYYCGHNGHMTHYAAVLLR